MIHLRRIRNRHRKTKNLRKNKVIGIFIISPFLLQHQERTEMNCSKLMLKKLFIENYRFYLFYFAKYNLFIITFIYHINLKSCVYLIECSSLQEFLERLLLSSEHQVLISPPFYMY